MKHGQGRISRFTVAMAGAVFAIASAWSGAALAEYPEKPITIVVGFGAGGGTDALARLIAKEVAEDLGQPVVVENKPGGGGVVAATGLKLGEPDGYTIGMAVDSTFAFAPLALPTLKYGIEDFDYVTSVASFQNAIVTNSDAPFSTWDEMIAHAKDGHDLSFASPSPVVKMVMATIAEQEGIKFKVIPVKGGKAVMKEVLGGNVDLGWSAGIHQAFMKGGNVVVLAASGEKRLLASPDAPTLGELGYQYNEDGYFLFFAPKGIPADRMEILSAAFQKASSSKKIVGLVSKRMGFPSLVMTPEETRANIERATEVYGALLKSATGG